MTKTRSLWLLFSLFLAAFIIFQPLQAGLAQDNPQRPIEEISDNEVNAVAKQLYCPVCENIPLDVCPTQACAEWRELIRLKISEGWNADRIKEYFAEQYGDRVLAAPPAHGFNWLVYILPPLVIAVGAYVLYRAFKAWKQPEAASVEVSASAPSTGSSPDPYLARLEEELKNR